MNNKINDTQLRIAIETILYEREQDELEYRRERNANFCRYSMGFLIGVLFMAIFG